MNNLFVKSHLDIPIKSLHIGVGGGGGGWMLMTNGLVVWHLSSLVIDVMMLACANERMKNEIWQI